jgi:hypothetical protein
MLAVLGRGRAIVQLVAELAAMSGRAVVPNRRPTQGPGRNHERPNKGMKLTSAERIERSQLIPGVRRLFEDRAACS